LGKRCWPRARSDPFGGPHQELVGAGEAKGASVRIDPRRSCRRSPPGPGVRRRRSTGRQQGCLSRRRRWRPSHWRVVTPPRQWRNHRWRCCPSRARGTVACSPLRCELAPADGGDVAAGSIIHAPATVGSSRYEDRWGHRLRLVCSCAAHRAVVVGDAGSGCRLSSTPIVAPITRPRPCSAGAPIRLGWSRPAGYATRRSRLPSSRRRWPVSRLIRRRDSKGLSVVSAQRRSRACLGPVAAQQRRTCGRKVENAARHGSIEAGGGVVVAPADGGVPPLAVLLKPAATVACKTAGSVVHAPPMVPRRRWRYLAGPR